MMGLNYNNNPIEERHITTVGTLIIIVIIIAISCVGRVVWHGKPIEPKYRIASGRGAN